MDILDLLFNGVISFFKSLDDKSMSKDSEEKTILLKNKDNEKSEKSSSGESINLQKYKPQSYEENLDVLIESGLLTKAQKEEMLKRKEVM